MTVDIQQLQELEETEVGLNPIAGCCYIPYAGPFSPAQPFTAISCFGCTFTS